VIHVTDRANVYVRLGPLKFRLRHDPRFPLFGSFLKTL